MREVAVLATPLDEVVPESPERCQLAGPCPVIGKPRLLYCGVGGFEPADEWDDHQGVHRHRGGIALGCPLVGGQLFDHLHFGTGMR